MKEKLKDKRFVYPLISVIALVLITIGVTYAYWLITRTQTNQNTISSACLDITLANEANDISLQNQFPMSDEEGMKLTPYEFTITNNCNTSVDYQIALEAIGSTSNIISSEAIKAVLNENEPKVLYDYVYADPTIDGASASYVLGYGTLSGGATSETQNLRVWINQNAPISEMNKTFESKITVTIGQGISAQGSTLATLIKDTNTVQTSTPNFSAVNADGERGLYSAADDYGTSYYFRGDVENNYVKLGTLKETNQVYLPDGSSMYGTYNTYEECMAPIEQGAPWTDCELGGYSEGDSMYWRIVRINGDGTVRLVYDGTSAVANGQTKSVSIKNTAYNNNDDAKYVGYTYDNGTDSTIKSVVDGWYDRNLKSDIGNYIADSIFCNDREVTSTSGNIQYYGAYTRLYTNKSPKLTCTREEDKYTVSSNRGNGRLSNPVGLMTADEVAMAGGKYGSSNSNYYLYTGSSYDWTMSPYYFDGGIASVWGVTDGGSLSYYYVYISNYVARPVINLKADTLFTGTGTMSDPYRLAE